MDESDKKSNLNDPLLSIVIPHYKGFDVLDQCLKSIKEDEFDDFEINVINNACPDKSIDKIKEIYPDINIINSEKNLGYAGGCNLGAVYSKGNFLLFLNNDTTHKPGWIKPLINNLINNESISSVQPKILNMKDKNFYDYAGAAGGFIDIFCFPFTRGRIFDSIEKDFGQYDDQQEIFWASGCAFMTRKVMFLDSGMFDEKLFAHMEEIDLHWKYILQGYTNIVEPKSIIYHVGGYTLNQGSFYKVYLNHRNSMILFLTNHHILITLILVIPKILLEIISIIRYLLKGEIRCALSQIYALIWIVLHPIYLIKRIIRINKIKNLSLFSILNRMYKPSIVFKYFILGKKKYSELVD